MASKDGFKSPEIAPKESVVKRKRASTVKFEPQPQSQYASEDLEARLKWVDAVLKDTTRNISPIRGYQLAVYQKTCAEALESELKVEEGGMSVEEIEQRRISWAATLRVFEESNEFRICLAQTQSKDADELREKLVDLVTLDIYGKYGDILALPCKLLRFKALQMNIEGAELLKKYWTDISRQLVEEQPAYEKMMKKKNNTGQCILHNVVQKACVAIGFELDEMLTIIHTYGSRNERMHSALMPLFRGKKSATLAKTLYTDLNNLPKIIPRQRGEEIKLLQTVISTMTNLWFVKKEGDEDNVDRWKATAALDEFFDEIEKVDPDKEAKVWEAATKQVTTALAERLAQTKSEESLHMKGMVKEVDEMYKLVTSERPPKRVPTADLEHEKKRQKVAKAMFRKLSSDIKEAHHLAEKYQEEFNELLLPPEIIHDPSLPSTSQKPTAS